MSNTVLVFSDPDNGIFPIAREVVDTDACGNPSGWSRMAETLTAVINAGYAGVKIIDHGKTIAGKRLLSLKYNDNTPEGCLAASLPELVEAGSPLLPAEQILKILERVYRDQGLQFPTNKNAR
jgi:hypothetical protein